MPVFLLKDAGPILIRDTDAHLEQLAIMGNSGGAAANSGIDFQQRIAALVMAHVIADVKDFTSVNLGDVLDVREIRFETNDCIDDLVIVSDQGRTYVQAKHSLSLSEKTDSEYSSVLKQFIAQHLACSADSDSYVIATSSRASQRITKELRKLTEAARLNEISSDDNPLTQAEKDVIEKTKGLLQTHFLEKTGAAMPDSEFRKLFKRIRVARLDIEDGAPLEAAVLTLLSGKSNVSPALLWGSLIALCLSLAKDRLSIDKAALIQRVGRFIGPHSRQVANEAAREYFGFQCKGRFSAGREVLLVKSPFPEADYLIVELYRFEDDGRKRVTFFDGKVKLLNGETWDVIHRASTYVGVERFVEEHVERFAEARIAIIPINSETSPEDEPYVRAHAEYSAQLAESLEDPLRCLHCGDPVSEDFSPVIEIEEEDMEHAVGIVHRKCMRTTDRALGLITHDLFCENKLLKNFDYTQWFLHAPRGQGLFSAAAHISNRICPIAWKPDYNRIPKGSWCVKIMLEDGSARYVRDRGKVVRYAEAEAHEIADHFNVQFDEARNKKDPWCYTSEREAFGTYSTALQVMTADETCIMCNSVTAVRYTQAIEKTYSSSENFYAPLVILLEEESGLPISVAGAIFLITNPLRLKRFVDNWGKAGIELPAFVASTIESDDEFDKFVRKIKDEGEAVIVDPMLNMSGELTSGFVIENYYELVKHGTTDL